MNIDKLLTTTLTSKNDATGQVDQSQHEQTWQGSKVLHENQVLGIWERQVYQGGFSIRTCTERNSLTDCFLGKNGKETPIQIKIIGRHMNGSFRCHIGTGKQSRPIHSEELQRQMKMMVVFFRSETCKNPWVLTEFLCFPTWLLHLFRYAHHDNSPGRTDVRFLENASLAKEDHIYRLNHVLNSLFRFQVHAMDYRRLDQSLQLANYLFDTAGLYATALPKPRLNDPQQPVLYTSLILLLQAPRPSKAKTMCHNCHSKPSSRRQLCVACYRYQLKHHESRPLRLIVASRPGPRSPSSPSSSSLSALSSALEPTSPTSPTSPSLQQKKKKCDNCGVLETHQWYRNLCGQGHWCETCKSYYLRHGKMRPPELFVKAAKRKVDVRAWMDSTCWRLDSKELSMANSAMELLSQPEPQSLHRRWTSMPPINTPSPSPPMPCLSNRYSFSSSSSSSSLPSHPHRHSASAFSPYSPHDPASFHFTKPARHSLPLHLNTTGL